MKSEQPPHRAHQMNRTADLVVVGMTDAADNCEWTSSCAIPAELFAVTHRAGYRSDSDADL